MLACIWMSMNSFHPNWYGDKYYWIQHFCASLSGPDLHSRPQGCEKENNICSNHLTNFSFNGFRSRPQVTRVQKRKKKPHLAQIFSETSWSVWIDYGMLLRHVGLMNLMLILSCLINPFLTAARKYWLHSMVSLVAVFSTCQYHVWTSKRNVTLSETTVRMGNSSVINHHWKTIRHCLTSLITCHMGGVNFILHSQERINSQGKDPYLGSFIQKNMNISVHANTHNLISFKRCMIMDTTELKSLTPVGVTLTFI